MARLRRAATQPTADPNPGRQGASNSPARARAVRVSRLRAGSIGSVRSGPDATSYSETSICGITLGSFRSGSRCEYRADCKRPASRLRVASMPCSSSVARVARVSTQRTRYCCRWVRSSPGDCHKSCSLLDFCDFVGFVPARITVWRSGRLPPTAPAERGGPKWVRPSRLGRAMKVACPFIEKTCVDLKSGSLADSGLPRELGSAS
jgi:hypothetical protein